MNALQAHEIPDHVTVITGKGGMPAIRVRTEWSEAEIYPHGAHVTGFQPKGEAPVLFMSEASEFLPDKPIRGGIPVIFPWFGPREGMAAHGFARLAEWELRQTRADPTDGVSLHFSLPESDDFQLDFIVTVGRSLRLELVVTNPGETDFTFESCLHTYFLVGAIAAAEVGGLRGALYRDGLLGTDFTDTADVIRFAAETERIYQDSGPLVEIRDPELGRVIRVRKSGSASTVVWNPWIAKSERMPDFGNDEYLRMVCVESGNVREHAITLPPGGRTVLEVEVDTVPLG